MLDLLELGLQMQSMESGVERIGTGPFGFRFEFQNAPGTPVCRLGPMTTDESFVLLTAKMIAQNIFSSS